MLERVRLKAGYKDIEKKVCRFLMISNINVQILRIGLRLRNSEGRIKAVRKQWTSEKEEEQRMVSSIITCQVTV